MFKKGCPFCDTQPIELFKNGIYYIFCPTCKKNDIIVEISSTNLKDAVDKWNNRWLEKKLLENPEEIIQKINLYKNPIFETNTSHTISKTELKTILKETYTLNKMTYGFLILKDGTIIECENSHDDELLRLTKTNYNKDINQEIVCLRAGILRICTDYNCIMVVIPYKTSKLQLNNAFLAINKLDLKDVNSYCVSLPNKDSFDVYSFKTLNELLLFLDDETFILNSIKRNNFDYKYH